jgi:hypothetical protein
MPSDNEITRIVIESLPTAQVTWIDGMTALLTPVIGAIAVYIAYQQHRINKQRELRESREAKFDVYKKVKRYINEVIYSGMTNKAYEELNEACAEADYLFEEDVTHWLAELLSDAAQWRDIEEDIKEHMEIEGKSRGEVWSEITEKKDFHTSWVEQFIEDAAERVQDANEEIKEKFSKYLELK